MLKNFIKRALLGALIGIAVCTVINIISCDEYPAAQSLIEKIGSLKEALILQTALSALYGALCMGTTVIYDAERMPLALMSLIHCLVCIVPFIPLSLVLGWTSGIGETLIMTAIQVIVYFIIWAVIYARYRKEIRELNEMQRHMHDTPEK